MPPQIVWFRNDLRLADQAAVRAAAAAGPVVAVFVLDDDTPGDWRVGAAQRWWLHYSLAALDADLRRMGGRLVLRRGPPGDVPRRNRGGNGARARSMPSTTTSRGRRIRRRRSRRRSTSTSTTGPISRRRGR